MEDDQDIMELLETMITDFFPGEILTANNAEVASEAIKQNQDIALVLSDYRMKGGGAPELYEFLREFNPTIPFAILSTYGPESHEVFKTFYEDHPVNFHLRKPFHLEELEEKIKKVLDDEVRVRDENYVRLSYHLIKRYAPHYGVSIRLSEQKYVLIIKPGEFDESILDNYANRSIHDYYLSREDFNSLIRERFERNALLLSKDEGGALIFDAIEEMQLALARLGVEENIVAYSKQVVEESLKSFKNYSKLTELLDYLERGSGYIQKHAYLTSFLAVAMARAGGERFSEADCRRLVMASLFKDLSLVESPELASIYTLKDRLFQSLSEANRHKVKIHMSDACHYLESIPEFDGVTRELVMAHHERPRGDGFPLGNNITTLSELSLLFIMACQFSHDLISEPMNPREIILLAQNYAFEYESPRFDEIYKLFLKAFNQLQPLA